MKATFLMITLLAASGSATAQIVDAIGGHLKDIRARFDDHSTIAGETLKKGEIDRSAKGQDALHHSAGSWSLVRVGAALYLQSGEDFRSSPGPDYHVYISRSQAIKDNDQFNTHQLEVGRLKKPNGAAYYKLPTTNADEVNSVLIWCKRFGEYIGSADLKATK